MAQQCFRNTDLERLHSGTDPSSKTGDYTDVKVISPFGEIPWPDLSRLNDDEIKNLMIEDVNKTYSWLTLLFTSDDFTDKMLKLLEVQDMVSYWNEPEITSM